MNQIIADGQQPKNKLTTEKKGRTLRQNRALYKLFQLLSDKLNDAGLDLHHTLREDIEIPWTPILVKELLWKKVQQAMTKKESTTDVSSHEIDMVFGVLNRHLGEKFGIVIEFPSIETLNDKLPERQVDEVCTAEEPEDSGLT